MARWRVESRETVYYYHEVEAATPYEAERCVLDGHDGIGNQIEYAPIDGDDFEIDEVHMLLPDCLWGFVFRLNSFLGGFDAKIFT